MPKITYEFVSFIHHVWMFLFMYGWLLIHAKARYGIMYAGVLLSTIAAWKIWNNTCPITILEDALKYTGDGEQIPSILLERWDLTGAFCFALLLAVSFIASAYKWWGKLPSGSSAHYFRTNSLGLVGVIAVLSLTLREFGNALLLANIAVGCIVAIVGLGLNFGRKQVC